MMPARYLPLPAAKSAQLILHDFNVLTKLAAEPYGFSFAHGARVYLQTVFRRLAVQLEHSSLDAVALACEAYRWGPVDVLTRCANILPETSMTKAEREELEIMMHDTFRHDVVSRMAILPRALRRGEIDDVREVLRGAPNYLWSKFLRSSLSAEVLYGHSCDVRVHFYLPGEAHIREGFALGKLALALRELVHNAVKYHDPTKSTRYVQVKAEPDMSRVHIIDNGIGIRDLDKVWDVGYREQRVDVDGTGLGLPSVKRRLAKLGWSIVVDSVPGESTTFTLTPAAGDLLVESR